MVKSCIRWLWAFVLGFACIALVGCKSESAAVNSELQIAINDVKSTNDPWLALVSLSNRTEAVLTSHDRCKGDIAIPFGECYAPEEIAAVLSAIEVARGRLLEAAIDHSENTDAVLHHLYVEKSRWWLDSSFAVQELHAKVRNHSIPKLLSYAEKASGAGRYDGALMLQAATIIENGTEIPKDSLKAMSYYKRAWKAGETQGAAGAAALYVSTGDVRNAYLWSVRCLKDCIRTKDVELKQLESLLPTREHKDIQRAAANPVKDSV